MPITTTYPGVYIEEIPSGVRTITGVATSITAFVGRALRGPVDEPITINNYGDFERIFGGLWLHSTMSFSVRDFYLNGGSKAIIVRLFKKDPSVPDFAELTADVLELKAAYPGAWGNNLRIRIDHDVSSDVTEDFGVPLFNLTVRDMKTGVIEQFRNLSVKDSPRRVKEVLENESNLIRLLTDEPPADIPAAHLEPDGKNIWEDDTLSTGVDDPAKASDGQRLDQNSFAGTGKKAAKKGLYALENADQFNLLCIPPYLSDNNIDSDLIGIAAKYCEDRRAMLLVDPPGGWKDKTKAIDEIKDIEKSKNAALFFPRLKQRNPLKDNQMEEFVPCGAVAGIFARTDTQRGVWKAPAGNEATLIGVPELSVPLTDDENGELNPLGINCLRSRPAVGRVVWGSRTLKGDDRLSSEWKYIPVRRMALYIEESLYRGTQWVVFEPNDEPLWAQIRLNVGAFMHNLFRQGAFQGSTPKEAYFVKCDKESTTQNDIDQGIVNIVVGFAPLKPAEFVIIKLQQIAGKIQT